MNTCKTCAYFGPIAALGRFGVCRTITDDVTTDPKRAYASDYEEYTASLMVGEEFGCTLWVAASDLEVKLRIKIKDIGMHWSGVKALANAHIFTIRDVQKRKASELKRLPGFGPKTFNDLCAKLIELNLEVPQ